MKKENVAFLLGGLAFGILLGFGIAHAIATRPGAVVEAAGGAIPQPAGPAAPSQIPGGGGGGGGAPMMAEIQALQQEVTERPDNAQAWIRLANLHHDVGMYPQAVGYYEKAVALVPQDPNVLTDLGVCYRGSGDPGKALEAFERAQKADPSHWQSLYNQVIVFADLGRHDEASAALARLKQVNPAAPNLAGLEHSLEHARTGVPHREGES